MASYHSSDLKIFPRKRKGATVWYYYVYDQDVLVSNVLEDFTDEIIDLFHALFTDWNERDDIKAELKVELILLLAKHKYPPVDRIKRSSSWLKTSKNIRRPNRDDRPQTKTD